MQSLKLPEVIFGTSSLGNLFEALDDNIKKDIIAACLLHSPKPVVFDSAGKYGAGLALECLGRHLKDLNVRPEDVIISNKLGWLRTELRTAEPTFEPGVWKELKHDAVQQISYEGILACYEQGNLLLNGYCPQMVSVHDPDEYLDGAIDDTDREQRFQDILEAYRALAFLKKEGKVSAVGVGSKQWKVIERISSSVQLDWMMIANSMTVKNHPDDLLAFIKKASDQGIQVINSAVFHAGFLTGGDFYDYVLVNREQHRELFNWRDRFFAICKDFGITPAVASVQFGLKIPGIKAIALNTTKPDRVAGNVAMANTTVPKGLWQQMKTEGLISFLPETA